VKNGLRATPYGPEKQSTYWFKAYRFRGLEESEGPSFRWFGKPRQA